MRIGGRAAAGLPVALASIMGLVLAAQIGVLAVRSASHRAPTTPPTASPPIPPAARATSAATPSSAARVVTPRVLVSLQLVKRDGSRPGSMRVMAINPARPSRRAILRLPAVPADQRSLTAGEEVYTRVLSATSADFAGCGVAGCSSATNYQTEQGLVLAGLHGEHPRVITRHGFDQQPSFSPDGRLIVYLSHRSHRVQGVATPTDVVALLDSSGRDLGVIAAKGLGSLSDPIWSPDSRAVAFTRYGASAGQPQIVVHSLAGGHERVIAHIGLRDLAWSPDGRNLVGVMERQVRRPGNGPASYTSSGSDLWLVPTSGGKPRQLTHFAPPRQIDDQLFCGEVGGVIPMLAHPSWSPDSAGVAVTSSYGHISQFARESDVLVVSATTGRSRTIFTAPPISCPSGISGYIRERLTVVDVLGWSNEASVSK